MRRPIRILTMMLLPAIIIACGGSDNDTVDNGSKGDDSKTTVLPTHTPARILAFPGADGGASTITGGAGGSVYIVNSLADDFQPGTLRSALSKGKRTIVFAVSGQINLARKLEIASDDITIAGQTAPGDGITIAGYPVFIKGSNIILRFLRFRMGSQNIDDGNFIADDGDALGGKDCQNILIDHCSISWSTDECASFSRIRNFTMQYCIISESLKLSGHSKGNHGYGGIWGGSNASYHHNLLAHHDSRNPRFDHEYVAHEYKGPIDYVNNVVYDWGGNSAYGGEVATAGSEFHINMVANWYQSGPSTGSGSQNRLMQLTSLCENCNKYIKKSGVTTAYPAKLYIEGNMVNGNTATWDNIHQDSKETRDTKSMAALSSRWTDNLTALGFTESAKDAYQSVLSYAGASLKRDAVDVRIINDVKNGTGQLVNSQEDVGGYPPLSAGTPQTDNDMDGMPDDWETEQMRLLNVDNTVNNFSPSAYNLSDRYTNLEVYLNSLVTTTFPAGANATAIK